MVRARALLGRLSLVTAVGAVCWLAAPASASASVPQVTTMIATGVTSSSATVEAAIDPEGSQTSYEIALECQGSGPGCEAPGAPQRQVGVLGSPSGQQTVSAEFTGLQAGLYYSYAVIATNASGREGWNGVSFRTCPSSGPCPMQPAPGGEQLWNLEAARREAEEAPALEAAREAAKREAEERLAREAAQSAAREIAAREAGERAGREAAEREAAARARHCVVPHLVGDSLAAARRSLAAAHCALGRVGAPRGHHGALMVSRQGVRAGRRLAAGSRIGVNLVARHR
jgi:hypothetical protein